MQNYWETQIVINVIRGRTIPDWKFIGIPLYNVNTYFSKQETASGSIHEQLSSRNCLRPWRMPWILTSGINSVPVFASGHAQYFTENRMVARKEQAPYTLQLCVSLTTDSTVQHRLSCPPRAACCVSQSGRGGRASGQDKEDKEDKVKESGKDTSIQGSKRPSSSCDQLKEELQTPCHQSSQEFIPGYIWDKEFQKCKRIQPDKV